MAMMLSSIYLICVSAFRKESQTYNSLNRQVQSNYRSNWVYDLPTSSKKVYSQSGQDGIIEEIFKHIAPRNKKYVEFGFGYVSGQNYERRLNGTNTYNLFHKGWTGWIFDALLEHKPIGLYRELLTPDSIVHTFQKYNIPEDVDYVSIDVDSIEVWLLKGLLESRLYKPQLISIEYNANFPYESTVTCEPRWQPWESDVVFGSSIGAILQVAGKFGYDIVHIERALDVFLVRRDVLVQSGGRGLAMDEMIKLRSLPTRFHKLRKNSKLERFIDFNVYEKTGDIDFARLAAKQDVDALKQLHDS